MKKKGYVSLNELPTDALQAILLARSLERTNEEIVRLTGVLENLKQRRANQEKELARLTRNPPRKAKPSGEHPGSGCLDSTANPKHRGPASGKANGGGAQ